MATSINAGVVDTADPLSNRLVVDMAEAIRMRDPDTSQFSTMLLDRRLKGDKADSYIVEWLEDRLIPRVLSLSASATSAATNILTGTGEAAYAKTGDIIRIPQTGEAVRVTASDASTSLTVVRGLGSVTAATAASGGAGTMIIVGGSNGEGAGLPTRLITKQVRNYNYTQIVRNSYGFTRTAKQSKWYGGNVLDTERDKKAAEHKTDLENMLFFGARAYSANSDAGHPQHQCGGLIEYISTNKTNAAGTLSASTLQNFLTTALQTGQQGQKVLFAAPKVVQVMSTYIQDQWIQAPPGTNYFGAKVDYVISAAFGAEVPVVVKRQWGEYGTGTAGQYGSMAFLVDMSNVSLAVMQPSVRLQDRQARDIDRTDEEYLWEGSFRVAIEESHSLLYNVTG